MLFTAAHPALWRRRPPRPSASPPLPSGPCRPGRRAGPLHPDWPGQHRPGAEHRGAAGARAPLMRLPRPEFCAPAEAAAVPTAASPGRAAACAPAQSAHTEVPTPELSPPSPSSNCFISLPNRSTPRQVGSWWYGLCILSPAAGTYYWQVRRGGVWWGGVRWGGVGWDEVRWGVVGWGGSLALLKGPLPCAWHQKACAAAPTRAQPPAALQGQRSRGEGPPQPPHPPPATGWNVFRKLDVISRTFPNILFAECRAHRGVQGQDGDLG